MNIVLSVVLFIIVLSMAIALFARSASYVYTSVFLLRRDAGRDIKDILYGILSIIYSILFFAGSILMAIASFHLVIL